MNLPRALWFSWMLLVILAVIVVALGLLKLVVFLLFMWLVTDLLVQGIGGRVKYLSKKAVLYTIYLVLLAGAVALSVLVIPPFVHELPVYLDRQLLGLRPRLGELGLNIDPAFDWNALREGALHWFQGHIGDAFEVAQHWGKNIFLFIFALILNFLFMQRTFSKNPSSPSPALEGSLLAFFSGFMVEKITSLYNHFRQVMAAQVVISAINTGLTLTMLIILGIPHKLTLVVLCFVFGLIPVVGNLISNTLICLAAFLWSGTWQAIAVLIFLVFIHKLEYFLNGKIIGDRTKLPMVLALLSLLLGEMAFHISGMILAIPLVLFIRDELAAVSIQQD